MAMNIKNMTDDQLRDELARREGIRNQREWERYTGERESNDACDLDEINPHMAEAMNR